MNLLLLTGLAKGPERESLGQEGLAALVLGAEQALRAGVVLDAAFWAGCDVFEREALAQAGDRLAAQRAALVGVAVLGARGVAALAPEGGKTTAVIDNLAEQAANAAAANRTLERLGLTGSVQ